MNKLQDIAAPRTKGTDHPCDVTMRRESVRVALPTCISAACVAVRTAGPGHEESAGTWAPAPSHPDLRTPGLSPSCAAQERRRKKGRGHSQPPFESGNLIPALPSREETVRVGGVGRGRLYSRRGACRSAVGRSPRALPPLLPSQSAGTLKQTFWEGLSGTK